MQRVHRNIRIQPSLISGDDGGPVPVHRKAQFAVFIENSWTSLSRLFAEPYLHLCEWERKNIQLASLLYVFR